MSIPFTWVYLIYDPFTDYYKIGKSDDPRKRLKQLCSPSNYGTIPAAPTNYELLEAWLCPEQIEKELHEYFEEALLYGEWFELSSLFDTPQREPAEVRHRVGEVLSKYERLIEGDTWQRTDDVLRIWSLERDLRVVPCLLQQIEHARLLGYIPPTHLLLPAPHSDPDDVLFTDDAVSNANAVDELQAVGEMAF